MKARPEIATREAPGGFPAGLSRHACTTGSMHQIVAKAPTVESENINEELELSRPIRVEIHP